MFKAVRLMRMVALVGSFGVLAFYGCDFSPTSPFEGFGGDSSQGVTLRGTFASSGTSSFGLKAFEQSEYEGLTVEVVGTGVFTTVGENGIFTLRGLPEGSFQLQFYRNGEPLGGPLPFEGVLPNQEITIVVELEGNAVKILEEKRNGIGHGHVELEGIASHVTPGTDHPNNGTLKVNGETIKCRANETAVRKGNRRLTLADIVDGDRVHVKGVWETPDGDTQNIFAHEIKLQQEDDGADEACMIAGGKVGQRINLEGVVTQGSMGDFWLDVNGNRASHPVHVVGGTMRCAGNKSCDLKPGSKVHVKGRLSSCTSDSATVDADEVKVQK